LSIQSPAMPVTNDPNTANDPPGTVRDVRSPVASIAGNAQNVTLALISARTLPRRNPCGQYSNGGTSHRLASGDRGTLQHGRRESRPLVRPSPVPVPIGGRCMYSNGKCPVIPANRPRFVSTLARERPTVPGRVPVPIRATLPTLAVPLCGIGRRPGIPSFGTGNAAVFVRYPRTIRVGRTISCIPSPVPVCARRSLRVMAHARSRTPASCGGLSRPPYRRPRWPIANVRAYRGG
jgi:hypothetical protein